MDTLHVPSYREYLNSLAPADRRKTLTPAGEAAVKNGVPRDIVLQRERKGVDVNAPYNPVSWNYTEAKRTGAYAYDGKPCKYCGGVQRYVSNRCCLKGCATRRNQADRNRYLRRREAAKVTMPEWEVELSRQLRDAGMTYKLIAEKMEVPAYWLKRNLRGEV